MSSQVKRRVDEIAKSASDTRLYRGLLLDNDMKVLLVSDATTDKSAAAMDVNVGYLSDPEDLPGLAHFCEHMIFMGTTKYPRENEYHKFLAEHGGESHAWTTFDHTEFYFDVLPEHLAESLEIFAQFFISPLFTEGALVREVDVIESEFLRKVQDGASNLDTKRRRKHPYYKFSMGNKETLETIPRKKGIKTRERLQQFYQTWYSANMMSLVIMGKEGLDELKKMAVDLFSDVVNSNVVAPTWPKNPFYKKQQQKKMTFRVPIKDERSMELNFPLPDLHQHYNSWPCHYLWHLIGHRGPGSLFSALRARSWCTSIRVEEEASARGFGFFTVTLDLTEEGIEHVDDTIKLMFQYINMLRREKPQEWIYAEIRDIMKMEFDFQERISPSHFVSEVVHKIQYIPLEDVLCAKHLIREWRPDLINMVLEYFNPDNIHVEVVGQKFASIANQRHEWYGSKFVTKGIKSALFIVWKTVDYCEELMLPLRNEFIATDLSIKPQEQTSDDTLPHPIIIRETPLSRVWFKQDDKFLQPKADLKFSFLSPLVYLDPISYSMTGLFVNLVEDSLNEYAYTAKLAGLHWRIVHTMYGIDLRVFGYSSKQLLLLDKIMEKITNFKNDAKRFSIMLENYIRSLDNFEKEEPLQLAEYYLAHLLYQLEWTTAELLASSGELTLERTEAFIPLIFSKLRIECLIHGNVDKTSAYQLVDLVETRLQSSFAVSTLLQRQLIKQRQVRLEDRCNYVFQTTNSTHIACCVKIYYQCGLQSTQTNILLNLFVQIIKEPCYNILRTKEHLGYVVFCRKRLANGVQGLAITVESEHDPWHVDDRVEAFLASTSDYIKNLTDSEFELHKNAIASKPLAKAATLYHLPSSFEFEISTQQYNFHRDSIEGEHLRSVTRQDLLNFFEDMIHFDAPHRRKLAVHVISTAQKVKSPKGTCALPSMSSGSQATLIQDITQFKSSHPLFPRVQPFAKLTEFAEST